MRPNHGNAAIHLIYNGQIMPSLVLHSHDIRTLPAFLSLQWHSVYRKHQTKPRDRTVNQDDGERSPALVHHLTMPPGSGHAGPYMLPVFPQTRHPRKREVYLCAFASSYSPAISELFPIVEGARYEIGRCNAAGS